MVKAQTLMTDYHSLNPCSVTYLLSVLGKLLNLSALHFLHILNGDNNVPISPDYSRIKYAQNRKEV